MNNNVLGTTYQSSPSPTEAPPGTFGALVRRLEILFGEANDIRHNAGMVHDAIVGGALVESDPKGAKPHPVPNGYIEQIDRMLDDLQYTQRETAGMLVRLISKV